MVLIKYLKRRDIVVSLQVCHCTFLLTILALDKDHLKWKTSAKIFWGQYMVVAYDGFFFTCWLAIMIIKVNNEIISWLNHDFALYMVYRDDLHIFWQFVDMILSTEATQAILNRVVWYCVERIWLYWLIRQKKIIVSCPPTKKIRVGREKNILIIFKFVLFS